jgi:hypothetical protein
MHQLRTHRGIPDKHRYIHYNETLGLETKCDTPSVTVVTKL